MDTAIVEFRNENTGFTEEIEIPLSITANDLIYALGAAYHLDVSGADLDNHYLYTDNPISFMRGNRTLKEYGLRNGSVIIYKRG